MLGLEFLGWEVAEGGVQALGVVPTEPLDDGAFDLVSVMPGALVLDQLGLERAVEGLRHGIVVAVRDGADRCARAGGGEQTGEGTSGVADFRPKRARILPE